MLPSNLNLAIGKKKGYNKEILVSNTGMKTGSKKDIKRDYKRFPAVKPDVARRDPVEGRRPYSLDLSVLTEKHNDGKLAITILTVGVGLMAYHF